MTSPQPKGGAMRLSSLCCRWARRCELWTVGSNIISRHTSHALRDYAQGADTGREGCEYV
eukprot:716429-Lingulodinium_polyedra.AAC.1